MGRSQQPQASQCQLSNLILLTNITKPSYSVDEYLTVGAAYPRANLPQILKSKFRLGMRFELLSIPD